MKKIIVRKLSLNDIDKLIILEKKKWLENQLPNKITLATRINAYPELSFGAFCSVNNDALASLFLKPTNLNIFRNSDKVTWESCSKITEESLNTTYKYLFGISLTSICPEATDKIFAYFYGYLLKENYRSVLLGSPIPGYQKALEKEANLCVYEYVNRKSPSKPKLPYDPQLRYYYKRGFHHIISIQPDYFPHENSKDYGVILEGHIPLRELGFIWRHLPQSLLQKICCWAVEFTYSFKSKEWTKLNFSSITKKLKTKYY